MNPLPNDLATQLPLLPDHTPYNKPPPVFIEQQFTDLDMSHRGVCHVKFDRSDFTQTNLRGCAINNSSYDHCHFSQCDLSEVHIYGTDIMDSEFTQSSLDRTSLVSSKFLCQFEDTHFCDAVITHCQFLPSEFSNISWEGAQFKATTMRFARFNQVNFTGAHINDLILYKATGLSTVIADWILVGDDILSARLEKTEALVYLESLTHFKLPAFQRWMQQEARWRKEPELHPVLQQQLHARMTAQPEQPFAGMRLNRAALEWMIAEAMRTNAEFDLRGLDIHELELDNLPLRYLFTRRWSTPCGIDASQTSCRYVDVTGAYLAGSNFAQAKLHHVIADRADFSEANFTNATLSFTQAREASFAHARLDGTSFANADLQGADFSHASLRGTILKGANIDGAIFEGADQTDVQWE